jgi:CubicO group peptidase (beta-lactamase class C family)
MIKRLKEVGSLPWVWCLAAILGLFSAGTAIGEEGAIRAAAQAEKAPNPVLSRNDLEAWLDGYLPFAMERAHVAGAVVVVVKGGRVLLQKGYGYADVQAKRPVDPETTLFRAGSVSKLMTWTAVLQLVEQGKINLDQDINSYLDFNIAPLEGRPITMRNLMTHTAGFQDSLRDMIIVGPVAPALGDFLKQQIPQRIYPTGEVPAYSNYGAALAGYIVQRVSGQPFAVYMDQHVFHPLTMHHSTFQQPLPAALAPLLSKGYLEAADAPWPFEIFSAAPAGGGTVSGADIGKFMIAQLAHGELGGDRILTAKMVRNWHQTPDTTIHPELNRMVLGFFEAKRNGRRILAHEGDTRLFHSALSLMIDEDVGLFIALNSAGREQPATRVIRQALFEQFVDRYFPAAVNTAFPVADQRAHAALMVGHYQNSRQEHLGFFSLTSLLTQVELKMDDAGHLIAPLAGPNDRDKIYREISPFLWQEIGGKEMLAAKIEHGKVVMWGESGDASTVYLPVPAWRRADWWILGLLTAFTIVVVTLVAWPVGAYVGKSRVVPSAKSRRLLALTRAALIGVCLVVLGWCALLCVMLSTLFLTFEPAFINSTMQKWIWLLHGLSIAVLPAAALLATWTACERFRSTDNWRSSAPVLWQALVALSTVFILASAITFDLLTVGAAF